MKNLLKKFRASKVTKTLVLMLSFNVAVFGIPFDSAHAIDPANQSDYKTIPQSMSGGTSQLEVVRQNSISEIQGKVNTTTTHDTTWKKETINASTGVKTVYIYASETDKSKGRYSTVMTYRADGTLSAETGYVYNTYNGTLTRKTDYGLTYGTDGKTLTAASKYQYDENGKTSVYAKITYSATSGYSNIKVTEYKSGTSLAENYYEYKLDGTFVKRDYYVYDANNKVNWKMTDAASSAAYSLYEYDVTTGKNIRVYTFNKSDGVRTKETGYLWYTNTTTAKTSQLTAYSITYNTDGSTIKTAEYRTYSEGVLVTKIVDTASTNLRQEYQYTGGVRLTLYRTYTSGVLTAEAAYTYVASVNKDLQTRVSSYNSSGCIYKETCYEYYDTGKTKTVIKDTRSNDGKILLSRSISNYNTAGTIVLSIEAYAYTSAGVLSTYAFTQNDEAGKKITTTKSYYSNGKYVYKEYTYVYCSGTNILSTLTTDSKNSSGVILSRSIATYDSTGKIVLTSEVFTYSSGVLTSHVLTNYDTTGKTVVFSQTEVYSNGIIQSSVITRLESAVKEIYTYTAGVLTSMTQYNLAGTVLQQMTVYLRINGLDKVTDITCYDTNGNVVGKTDYDYYDSAVAKTQATYDFTNLTYSYVSYAEDGTILKNVSNAIALSEWNATKSDISTLGFNGYLKNGEVGWYTNQSGYVKQYIKVLADGVYQVSFRAEGVALDGVYPLISVSVDGLGVEIANVNSSEPGLYTVTLNLAEGIHSVGLDFVNATAKQTDPSGASEYLWRSVTIGDISIDNTVAGAMPVILCEDSEWEEYESAKEEEVLAEAEENIVASKTDATVTIVDESGNVIEGAQVTIEETESDFVFGTNYMWIEKFDTFEENLEYNLALIDEIAAISNQATVPLFWSFLAPQAVLDGDGNVQDISLSTDAIASLDLQLGLLAQKGITDINGATLVWENSDFMPQTWLAGLSNEQKKMALKLYIQKIIKMYSNKTVSTINIVTGEWTTCDVSINTWEVVGEPYYLDCFSELWPDATKETVIKEMYDWADEARAQTGNPNIKLMLNDYIFLVDGNLPCYDSLKKLVDAGVKFDILGIQAHHLIDGMAGYDVPYNLSELSSILDRYASLGKTMYITEFEMPSNNNEIVGSVWRGTNWDETTRSQYVKDFYTLLFSHPAIAGISYWDMVDVAGQVQYIPYSGLINADLTVKKTYMDLKDLINNQWKTKIEQAITDENGQYSFRGFGGTYKISVEVGSGKMVFYKDLTRDQLNDLTLVVSTVPAETLSWIPSSPSVYTEGQGFWVSAAYQLGFEGYALTGPGEVGDYFAVSAGNYCITVTASGSPAYGEYPEVLVKVDGIYVKSAVVQTVSLASFTNISVNVELTEGVHEIAVEFINDGYDASTGNDRNLLVNSIKIDPTSTIGTDNSSLSNKAAWIAAEAARETEIIEEAEATIEATRKSDAVITVVDESGNVIEGATVTINQTSSDFLFGANFALDGSKDLQYNINLLLTYEGLFNYVTIGCFWEELEPTADVPNCDSANYKYFEMLLGLATQMGMKIKASTILWGQDDPGLPSWVSALSEAGQIAAIEEHVRKLVSTYKEKTVTTYDLEELKKGNWVEKSVTVEIDDWEVVNEPFHYTGEYDLQDVYAIAKEANPDANLIINDYSCFEDGAEEVYEGYEDAINDGVSFDSIGLQAHHLTNTAFRLSQLETVLEKYAALGKSLYLTEFEAETTGEAVQGATWRGTWTNEMQAKYIADFYKVMFASSAIAGITYWDIIDNASSTWCPYGGLLNEDLTAKASYTVLKDLILNQWRTNIDNAVTNSAGQYAFRGFTGTYEVTVTVNGVSKTYACNVADGDANNMKLVF